MKANQITSISELKEGVSYDLTFPTSPECNEKNVVLESITGNEVKFGNFIARYGREVSFDLGFVSNGTEGSLIITESK